MQFFNQAMVLRYVKKLYSSSSLTTKNLKHLGSKTVQAKRHPPKMKMRYPGNRSRKKCIDKLAVCAVAPSCYNHKQLISVPIYCNRRTMELWTYHSSFRVTNGLVKKIRSNYSETCNTDTLSLFIQVVDELLWDSLLTSIKLTVQIKILNLVLEISYGTDNLLAI